ncbi:helix-turn-helix domain-containing protein [Streptomyces bauhiniae]|uniref:helix-turn-helix domain-containing protein n=1 Tax=Streptomyces bauhiniae TaxID=2340725 RepID=UPI0037D94928
MFTPERLVVARKRRRMTLAELAHQSGVSAQSITAFENHRKVPSPETISSIASALHYPVRFFEAPAPAHLELDAVSFRAPSKMSAAERDSALSSGMVAVALNEWMQGLFKLPSIKVPTYPHLEPEAAAEQVRAAWGLGEAPVPNALHLIESNGVRVFSLPSDCLDIDAFSTIKFGTPYVFLNTRKTGERGRFDVAHELGHLVLHCEHRIPHGRDSEKEANDFASAFLMPRAGIIAQRLHNASLERILSAKRKWGVSAMALTYRLRKLELLSEWRYSQTMKELARRGYRRAEPDSSMVRESSQLLGKVFGALRKPLNMTFSDLADELNIYPEELNEYVFGLAPIGVASGGQSSMPARPKLRLVGGSDSVRHPAVS